MPTFTPNFGLAKPLVNNVTDQDRWGGQLNDDMDIIDAQLKVAQDFVVDVKTANYAVLSSDKKKLIACDATSASFVVTLPLASVGNGFVVAIKKTDASVNTVTIDGSGAETIDGDATLVLSIKDSSVVLTSDGVNWLIVASEIPVVIPDASTTVKGIIEIATDAEVAAGTDTVRAVTPSGLKNSLGISNKFTSTNITISVGGGDAQNHPFGAVPSIVLGYLVCTTADAGYSVGDVVRYDSTNNRNVSGVMMITVWANATQVGVGFGASGGAINISNKTTKNDTAINLASWRYVIKALG